MGPAGYSAGTNFYAYTDNDPLNNTNPSGKDAFGLSWQVGGDAGALVLGISQQEGGGIGVFYPGSSFIAALFAGNVTIGRFGSQTNANQGPTSVASNNYFAGAAYGVAAGPFYANGISNVNQLNSISPTTFSITTPALGINIISGANSAQNFSAFTVGVGEVISMSNVPSTFSAVGPGK